ncbi:YtxH domain-containing protein [Mesobacillus subterraneus]|uniref:YtxH domain-containing protein n=1 Tax=Mesobacillus subterraneus TaxID=285983 RepID=UPI001CFC9968|nr:YtxH domain-containing protein [Mesobacillus subterraneus]WLR53961.1 YtxH domain-containing protein [Mesobacillus subterraneus]
MKAKKVLAGMVIGGVVASIATLLSTPKSGYETRRTLIANKNEYMESIKDIKDSAVELKNTVATASKEGKASIQTFITDVKTAIFEWKLETEENKKVLQEDVMELEDSIKDLETELAAANSKEK